MSKGNDRLNRDAYADFAKKCYEKPDNNNSILVNGVDYKIVDSISTPNGFQATVYQHGDQFVIAYRGTEIKPFNFRETGRDLIGADYGMVKDQLNVQTPDADAFTQRVLDNVKKQHPDWNLSEHVHLTGHSLGDTHAQIEAAKHGLGGAGFNGYGAVDLGYHVPEGQPKKAPAFDEYVRATDVVSAASRHYGTVHVFATEKDIANLQAGRYLSTPDLAHPANPLLTADIAAHFISNFDPDPGEGESIMTTANEARYHQHQAAIDHYRGDVQALRIDLHDLLNHGRHPAQAARLEAKVFDALDVARYSLAVSAAEQVTSKPYERHLQAASEVARASGQTIHAVTAALAQGTRAAGQTVQTDAEQWSHGALEAGQTLQQSAIAISRQAMALPDPLMAAGVSLGAKGVGYLMHAEAEALALDAHLAGQLAHAAAENAAQQIHAAGQFAHAALDAVSAKAQGASQSIHDANQRLASTRTHDAIVDKIAQVERGAQALRQRVELPLERTYDAVSRGVSQGVHNAERSASRAYDTVTHPAQWFHPDALPAPAPTHSTSAPQHPQHPQAQAITPTRSNHARNDPRHPDNPNHALYAALKERIPEAGESRLVQFTAACHTHKINEQNLTKVFLNEHDGLIDFAAGGLRPAVTSIDIKQPPPPPAQSIQQIQQHDQQQLQINAQVQTQMAQTSAQAQQGPTLGER